MAHHLVNAESSSSGMVYLAFEVDGQMVRKSIAPDRPVADHIAEIDAWMVGEGAPALAPPARALIEQAASAWTPEVIAAWIDQFAEEPVDPTTRTITKRQLVAALIIGAGVTEPDAFIEGAIATIPDATGRALALNDWRNAPYYVRGHALFNDPDMLGAIGKSPAEIDQLWALAVTLPA